MVKRQVKPHAKEWGAELRRFRSVSGKTQKSLSVYLTCSDSLISGFEKGTYWPSRDMAAQLDALVGAGGELVQLWERLSNKQAYPEWLSERVKAEPRAALIREFETVVIPGLFQTESYAHTLIRANNPLESDEKITELVEGRMGRQLLWKSPRPPRMVLILNEAALTACIGGVEVMVSQLDRLVGMIETNMVRLHIIPADTEQPPSTSSFSLLTFEDRHDTLYVEDAVSGSMVTDQKVVRRFDRLFGDLQGAALSAEKSLKRLYEIRRESQDGA
ncbi:helix-turn-helix domain-containing protein [Nocardiopsis dassonvillei]|uniref:helix-turn-helix domain-containing protein n=1 Tax=Nocardiopsis dassonvillei TaxID=2014 RepID=UPI00200F6C21|nr:helix-turn-helix transcriptional regulator [Nocardiopsis dassonvillei]MCK9873695.1 helix-turn-helix domain-containing protein [Nocardiopsis dassonvillei]